jgi:hypothetical protein
MVKGCVGVIERQRIFEINFRFYYFRFDND